MPVRVPSARRLYRGTQVVRRGGLEWEVSVAGGTALVEPPRFTLDDEVPDGTRFQVADSHHLTVPEAIRAYDAETANSS